MVSPDDITLVLRVNQRRQEAVKVQPFAVRTFRRRRAAVRSVILPGSLRLPDGNIAPLCS